MLRDLTARPLSRRLRLGRLLAGALFLLGVGRAPAFAPAFADVVSLDDGRELEGTVVEETDKLVRLRVDRGQGTALIEVPREKVVHVFKGAVDASKLHGDAKAALAQGDREGAIKILRKLTTAKPDDAGLRRELAFAELMSEDLASARDDYARAVALDGTDVESLMGLGYVSRRGGERDTAISAYRSATRSGPQHPEAWRALVELLLERDKPGDRDEAVDAGRRGLNVAPTDGRHALLAAEALARATGVGARDEQLAALGLLEGFAREHGSEPLAPKVVERAAALATRIGELERARAVVTSYVASRPVLDEATRGRVLALEAHYSWLAAGKSSPTLGVDVVSDRLDLAAAARLIAVAIEVAPAEGELYLLRARLAARGGHLPEAALDADKAHDLLPAGEPREDAALVAAFVKRLDHELKSAPAAPATPTPATPTPATPTPATPTPGTTVATPRADLLPVDRAKRLVTLIPFFSVAHEDLARSLEAAGQLDAAHDALEAAKTRAVEADRERLTREIERVDKLRALRERNKDL